MNRTLARPCISCGTTVRGKARCPACQGQADRAKRARRPDLDDHHERERRRRVVADHRSLLGDWCPGLPDLRRPAHPAADLTADHVREVALGGRPDGPLVVRCRSCNAARSAHRNRRSMTRRTSPHPSPAEPPITHSDGPVVA